MKITKTQLRKLIREEVQGHLVEMPARGARGAGARGAGAVKYEVDRSNNWGPCWTPLTGPFVLKMYWPMDYAKERQNFKKLPAFSAKMGLKFKSHGRASEDEYEPMEEGGYAMWITVTGPLEKLEDFWDKVPFPSDSQSTMDFNEYASYSEDNVYPAALRSEYDP